MTIFTPETLIRCYFGLLVFMLPMAVVAAPLTPFVEKFKLRMQQRGWKGFAWASLGFVLVVFALTVSTAVGYKVWTHQPLQDFLTALIQDILSM